MLSKQLLTGGVLLTTVFTSLSYSQTTVPGHHVDSTRITVTLQERKDYRFNDGTIGFSNRFSAARYNGVTQINDSTFAVVVDAENRPINSSPWYAFKVWSTVPREIHLQLQYPEAKHRYQPKISSDGIRRTTIDEVSVSPDKKSASFKVGVSSDTLTVAGQEIKTAAETYNWTDSLAALPGVDKSLIGSSILGRPIYALNTKNSDGKKVVVILGRQHPPEITGYLAMKHFTEVLFSSSEQADKFRKAYEVVLIPMLNPDGIEEGHWRHNMAGVDINRDWVQFKQPETTAVRDYLTDKLAKQDGKLIFAIDFHSTFFDILYTNEDDPSNHRPGLMGEWMAAIQREMPEDEVKAEANYGPKRTTSLAWFQRAFKAEAVTYEIGDKTARDLLKKKSEVAAEKLMDILLNDTSR